MWECPNLLHFGNRSLLVISPQSLQRVARTGLACGLAGETACLGAAGHARVRSHLLSRRRWRALLTAVLSCGVGSRRACRCASVAAGWSGVISVPIEVTLDDDGAPQLAPVRELETLRRDHRMLRHLELAPTPTLLDGITGDTLDLTLDLLLAPGAEVALLLRCTPDFSEQTVVRIGGAEPRITVEHIADDLQAYAPHTARWAPLRRPSATSYAAVLLDRSTLESFRRRGQNRAGETSLLYPQKVDALGVGLFCTGHGRSKLWMCGRWQPFGEGK